MSRKVKLTVSAKKGEPAKLNISPRQADRDKVYRVLVLYKKWLGAQSELRAPEFSCEIEYDEESDATEVISTLSEETGSVVFRTFVVITDILGGSEDEVLPTMPKMQGSA